MNPFFFRLFETMKRKEYFISWIFLILFGFIQLVDLHQLSHDQEDADCEICILISEEHADTFTYVSSVSIPPVLQIPVGLPQPGYCDPIVSSSVYATFLNKAPPYSLIS